MNSEKILCYRTALLLGQVILSGWQVYTGLDSILGLTISGIGGKFGWVWLVSGPVTFFFAASLGAISSFTGLAVKAGPIKKFWGLFLLVIVAWLGLGCLIFAWADWFGTHFGFTLSEHLSHFAFIILPAVACTGLFWTIQRDMRRAATKAPEVPNSGLNDSDQSPWRKVVSTSCRWLGALVGAGSSILVVTASALFLLLWGCEPPSVATLARRFPGERKDLEMIIAMSDEDSQMAVIDPTWLELQGLYSPSLSDRAIGISSVRWEEYRQIFRRNGITQGIRRYAPKGDAFIIVKSIGILDNGYSNGYLYCIPGTSSRYEPCSSSEQRGEHPYTGGDVGYEFIKLTDHWYAYRQGPG
jgi:hypothetical protein